MIHVKGVDLDKNTFFGKAMRFAVISKQLYRCARKNIKEGDKVLLVTNPAPVVALISKLRKKYRFELNILVHDVFPENTKPAGFKLPKLAYGILKNVFDKAYSRADQLIAIGRDMKQVLEKKCARFDNHPKVTGKLGGLRYCVTNGAGVATESSCSGICREYRKSAGASGNDGGR